MKVGEIVHLPNATQNGPLCGKVSALALSVECTMDVQTLTCIPCALALMDIQAQGNAILARRVGFLFDQDAQWRKVIGDEAVAIAEMVAGKGKKK